MNSKTPIEAPREKYSAGTNSVPRVSTTLVPTVNPPISTKTAISPDASRIDSTPLPVAGPNAAPVEEPPMFVPTKTAVATPTTSSQFMITQ